MLKKIFGKNVRYYRYQKGFSQEKLAEVTDLNVSYISELERGNYGATFETIEKIAKGLRVEAYILFQETDNTHKKLPKRVDMK